MTSKIYKDIYYQLGMIEEAAKRSSICKSHNMIGTSILIILGSDGKCKVKVIDFARSYKLEDGEGKHNFKYITNMKFLPNLSFRKNIGKI